MELKAPQDKQYPNACESRLLPAARAIAGWTLSLLVHAGLIYVLVTSTPAPVGDSGTGSISSVEVTLVPASVLDQQVGPQTPVAPPEAAAAAPPKSTAPEVAPEIPDISEVPTLEPAPAEPAREPSPTPGSPSQPSPPSVSTPFGGGRVEASKAEIEAYAREVVLALAHSKPRRSSGQGRVLIQFVLSEAGELLSAEIKKSSGSTRLDRIALKSVQSAQFPKPPQGMTEKQRSYLIPYEFR
ncbi:MAG: energy transducer TonB [Bdellovibrionales bacterium]